jgi:hypothetical protein
MASSTWPHAPTRPGRSWALLALEGFVGLTAAVCGVGLIVYGLGIPEEELDGTPFDSFLVPGLLLSLVVGGSLLAAAWTVWQRLPQAPLVSAAAGCVLLGWIVGEAILIDGGRGLQAAVLAFALLIIGLAWQSGPLVPRRRR